MLQVLYDHGVEKIATEKEIVFVSCYYRQDVIETVSSSLQHWAGWFSINDRLEKTEMHKILN